MKKILTATGVMVWIAVVFIAVSMIVKFSHKDLPWILAAFAAFAIYIVWRQQNDNRRSDSGSQKRLERIMESRAQLRESYKMQVLLIKIIAMENVGLLSTATMTPMMFMARLKKIDGPRGEIRHFLRHYVRWIGHGIEDSKRLSSLKSLFRDAGIDDLSSNILVKGLGTTIMDELQRIQSKIIQDYGDDIRHLASQEWETNPNEYSEELASLGEEHIFRKLKLEELIPQQPA